MPVKNPAKKPDDLTQSLWDRIWAIKNDEKNGLSFVREFGIFVDTHRDQPHVGTFDDDVHRGMCKPTPVDYIIEDDLFYEPESGVTLKRHGKHQFIDPEWLANFEFNEMLDGKEVRDSNGFMPTSHLRDARAHKYHMWSFRQTVMSHFSKLP
jgi:hypothetical protein